MAAEERVDKYLFAMRIYKTRSIAADACKNGRVKLNGVELKPSRTFHVGDVFTVRKGPVTYTYRILALSGNRLGAKLVPEYLQDITSPEQLEVLQLARLAAQSGRDRGTGRPTKKDRRDIETFISDDFSDFDFLDDEDDDVLHLSELLPPPSSLLPPSLLNYICLYSSLLPPSLLNYICLYSFTPSSFTPK